MAASALQTEAVGNVESLPFVTLRRPLLRDGITDAIDKKRKQDRTVQLVMKWETLRETLPRVRAQTLTCLEAVEGKGGVVTLKIFDRPKWDQVQKSIAALTADLESIEAAIRELDSFAATEYLFALHDTRTSLGGVEAHSRAVLTSEASAALLRGQRRGHAVEEALEKDEIYQSRKKRVESQVETAKKSLASVSETIAKIDKILAGVGC